MDEDIVAVQQVTRQILSGMGIQKVISVDDFYATAESHYEDAVALFEVVRSKQDIQCSDLVPRDILDAPDNIWTRRLQAFWTEASPDSKSAILNELAVIAGDEIVFSDVKDLSRLKEFIPEGMFQAMSPDDWDQNKKNIIAKARNNQRILCLFDQDLHLAGRSDNAGTLLLQQTLTERNDDCVVCGLLTQMITREAELETARTLAAEVGLTLDQFLPLSKERLRGDPMEFVDGLKMILLNYARHRLSRQVQELTIQASKEALEKTNDIDVYDFEHIVIRSSEGEGVWEPDTLFRLFNLFEYDAFRRAILVSDRRASIYVDIERMRAVRSITTLESQRNYPTDKVYQIRRMEVFDEPELLNAGYQPIDLGDIFEIRNKKYILLAQPCDLMVRENGARSQGIDDAVLVQIRVLEEDEEDIPGGISSFRCEYLGERREQIAFVKFRNSIRISLSVLDLAVFNDEGKCYISLSDIENTKFPTLHVPWRKRLETLQKHYQKTHTEFVKMPYQKVSAYQKKALGHLLTCSAQNISFQYDARGIFEFDIRRVGRYRAPLSVHLLSAYFSFLSRNPQEHDFARAGENLECAI
ncbi:MAG: hypothetical protein JW934_19520 [Anaerolineae bacterium]|nr:hypothetical protein [Anaerolineae bacterium]